MQKIKVSAVSGLSNILVPASSTKDGLLSASDKAKLDGLGGAAVSPTVLLIAGNGLTGGGDLTANRTFALGTPDAVTLSSTNAVTTTSHTHSFVPGGTAAQYIRGDGSLASFPTIPTGTVTSITAGNGLSFASITNTGAITLGTPSTVSGSTTNSVTTTSHTHALSANLAAWDGISPTSKQNALGFNPVQQGTGVGQNANTIKIGWSNTAGRLKVTVDSTDQGNVVFDSHLAGYATTGHTHAYSSLTGLPNLTTPTFNDAWTNGWFRVNGGGGIYWETYGGGINMTDSTWIRTYGGKNFYCNADLRGSSVVTEDFLFLNAAKSKYIRGGLGQIDCSHEMWAPNHVATSDGRLKENIKTISNEKGMLDVMKLRPVTFDWKESGKSDLGFVAQEVREVHPELVREKEDGTLAMSYGNVTATLTAALQGALQRIADLEAMVNEMRERG